MSNASSIIGALGAGSGVDMAKLAGDLSAARFAAQVKRLEAQSGLTETRISAAAALKGQLSQLASALGERVRDGALAPAASVANTAVASASVAPGAKAAGSYSLEVTRLATGQILGSRSYASADAKVGAGNLAIRFGTVSGTGFAADPARPAVSIAVTASDTLATLADKIGASGAGLTAYVANGPAGAQLVVKGPEGAASGFTLTGTGASASGTDVFGRPVAPRAGQINYLDWAPASDGGRIKQAAGDAAFLFDGVAMTSPRNQVEGLPAGLSLTLTGTNAGAPTRISFAAKDEAIGAVMKDLAAALNEIAAKLREVAKPVGGELGNDGGARALKHALASLPGTVVMPGAAPGAPRTLGDLGLSLERDGTFRLDSERLTRTLKDDPQGAAAMFTPGLHGVYATVEKLARTTALSSDPGSLGGSVARYQRQQGRIGEQLEQVAQRQEALRAQMSRRFAQSDGRVAASQGTLSFLQNQIAAWNAADR